jgi:molybdenum cofactor cytidylyltransferase
MNEPAIRVAAIVLAAGASTRMCGPNKLMLDVRGEPLVRRVVRAVAAARVSTVTVVTGHQHEQVESALADLGVSVAFNADHPQGQGSSVRAGLAATREADAYLIVLGDQAWLTATSLGRLIDVYVRSDRSEIVIPVRNGERGNPIVLPRWARTEILSGAFNLGCRDLIAKNPTRVLAWPALSDSYFEDVDTPGAYRALIASLHEEPHAPRVG